MQVKNLSIAPPLGLSERLKYIGLTSCTQGKYQHLSPQVKSCGDFNDNDTDCVVRFYLVLTNQTDPLTMTTTIDYDVYIDAVVYCDDKVNWAIQQPLYTSETHPQQLCHTSQFDIMLVILL